MDLSNYEKLVLSDTPLGYWPLDDASGTTALDRADNDAPGVYGGSPSLASRNLNTALGSVVDLDGSNDGVSIVNGAGLGGQISDVTFEAWTVFDSVSGTRFIAEQGPHGTDAPELYVWWNGGASKFIVGWRNGTTYRDHELVWTPSVGVLYHLVVTVDGSDVKLYANGKLRASTAQVGAPVAQSGGSWYLGVESSGANRFDGALGHVALYGYAMTAAFVSLHYLSGLGVLDTSHGYGWLDHRYQTLSRNPSTYWLLEGNLDDASGFGDDLTLAAGSTSYATDAGPLGEDVLDASAGDWTFTSRLPQSAYTLSAWVNPAGVAAGGDVGAILGDWGGSGATGAMLYLEDGTTQLKALHASTAIAGPTLPVGTWSHVAMAWDGSIVRLFVNGNVVGYAVTSTAPGTSSVAARLSNYGTRSNARRFPGLIGRAAMHDTALTPGRISRLYLSGLGELDDHRLAVLQDAPKLYWQLQSNPGHPEDSSGWGKGGDNSAAGVTTGAALLPGDVGSADLNGSPYLYAGAGGADTDLDVGTGDFAVEFWTLLRNTGGNFVELFERDSAGSGSGIDVYLNKSGYGTVGSLRVWVANTLLTGSTVSLLDSALHHVVVTRLSGTVYVYLDGKLELSGTASGDVGSHPIHFGDAGGAYHRLDGRLAHVAYYPSGLEADRVAVHYVTGLRTVYADLVASLGAAAYWPLDDDGPWVDSIGSADLSATIGTPVAARGFVPSLGTPAIELDGASAASASSNAGVTGTSVTLQAWVRPPVTNQGAWLHLGDAGGADGWSVGQGNSSNFEGAGSTGDYLIGLVNNAADGWKPSGQTIPPGTWYHVAVVFTPSATRFYVDGELVATDDGASRNSPSAYVAVGGNNAGGYVRYWEGLEAHAAIFNVALTDDEVRLLDAAAWWSYVEGGSGTSVDFGPWEVELEDPDVVFEWVPSVDLELEVELEDPDVVFDLVRRVDWLYLEVVSRTSSEFIVRPKGRRRRTVVVDVDGNAVGAIGNAKHGPITWELNRWEEASFTVPLADEAAGFVVDERIREVQLWRGDRLLMVGPMAKPSTDGKVLTVNAHGPAWYLSRRTIGKAERRNYLLNGDFEDGKAFWSPWRWDLQIEGDLPGKQLAYPDFDIVRDPVVVGSRALRSRNYVAGTANSIVQGLYWTVDEEENPEGDTWALTGYMYVESYAGPAKGYNGVELTRLSTTELWDDPWVQSVVPGAMKIIQIDGFRVDERTPLGQWLPFSVEFTTPPKAGEPENLFIQLRAPVGVAYWDRVALTRVESTSWYRTDQATIIRELVEEAQRTDYEKSDVNLDGVGAPTGILRDLVAVHHEHPNVWNLIQSFTTVEDGVDVSVDITPTTRKLRTHFPAQGTHLPRMRLELNRNVASFAWSYEGDSASNAVIVLGPGNGSGREEAFAIRPDAFAGGLTLEEIFSAPDGTRVEFLDVIAGERATVSSSPELLAVKTHPHSEILEERNLIGRLGIGDTVPVAIHSGALALEGIYRIVRMTLNPDDTLDLVLNRRDLHR